MKRSLVRVALLATSMNAVHCGATTRSGTDQSGAGDDRRDGSAGDAGAASPFVSELFFPRQDKLDVLLVVDNSPSMAGEQQILSRTIADLVGRFALPACLPLDETGPALRGVEGDCPAGTYREFEPVRDIHLGVITSSLYFGADVCHPERNPGGPNAELDDRGWLLGALPRGKAVTGLHPEGFLDWNPDENPGQSLDAFTEQAAELILTAGESGCGFEAPLEAWYRFLVDPAPPASIEMGPCAENPAADCAFPAGIDQELLRQRAAFLRPDSTVAIVMLTDENDCSVQLGEQFFYIGSTEFPIPAASVACATDPNDPCCYSCGKTPPKACKNPDPACIDASDGPRSLTSDPYNLRCWDQKRRFGLDFLYPTERYVNALSDQKLCTVRANLETRFPTRCKELPVQSDFHGNIETGPFRGVDQVLLAGIVGVPWQAVQSFEDAEGNAFPAHELHYATIDQLDSRDEWARIVGDPESNRPPANPLMLESVAPRGGTVPTTGESVAPPNAGYLANGINGHEWLPERADHLQYACTFPLIEPRDCSVVGPEQDCDCERSGVELNPTCQAPDGSYDTLQRFGSAYPSLRLLKVLDELGEDPGSDFVYPYPHAVAASVCARNVTDPSRQDFGYRPAMDAVVARLAPLFRQQCLPIELPLDEAGHPRCRAVEAIASPNAECDASRGRQMASAGLAASALGQMRENHVCGTDEAPPCDATSFTLCEIRRDDEGCLEVDPGESVGWCYIDPARGLGDERLVGSCGADEKRRLRVIDPLSGAPRESPWWPYLVCEGLEPT